MHLIVVDAQRFVKVSTHLYCYRCCCNIYIYIYIYIISVWICRNMATEISLIYPLTEPCSEACFFFFFFFFFDSYFLFI